MTTIQLTKSGVGTITIYSSKIQELLTKEIISYAYPFPPEDQGTPTSTKPRRESLDLLNIQRVFTITGIIKKESVSGASSAPEARDVLMNMARYGGTLFFKYGAPSDTQGKNPDTTIVDYYNETSNNIYYTSTGFECHVTKIQVDEDPKGGASADQTPKQLGNYGTPHKMPEEYEITITLMHATKISD